MSAAASPSPRRRERRRLALLLAISVGVSLAAAEIVVRIVSPMLPLGGEIQSTHPMPMLRFERSVFARHMLPAVEHTV